MNDIKKLSIRLSVCVLMLAPVMVVPAAADIYYVVPGQSIQAAIDAASNDDEIEVAPGTYNEAINFKGKAIRLYSSDGPEVTTIDGSLINSFQDDFNDGDYTGWQVVDEGNSSTPSSWSAATGEMVQSSNIYTEPVTDERFLGTYALCTHKMPWGDYEVTLSMKALDDEWMGVMFRYVDPNNYYRFAWNGTSLDRRLVKMEDGSVTTLQQDNSIYFWDQWYNIRIAVHGRNLKVFVDDVQVFDVNDSSFSSGAIALYCWGNRGTYFDNIEVKWPVLHVVQCVNGEDANTILEGFTITGGRAGGPEMNDKYGGGMFCDSSSPRVSNCIFTDNSAESGGGGIYNWISSPTVTDCTFSGNSTSLSGGGMYNNNSSSPMVVTCTFYNNTADLHGGGMCNSHFRSRPTVTNCTFIDNSAAGFGGGMYNGNANPTVIKCTFIGNTARSNHLFGGGGGIYNNGDSPTVTDCNFSGNSAYSNGGGMFNGGGTSATVNNCTFTGNTALSNTHGGGGMYNDSGNPTVTNCTFSTNHASQLGGGMYNYDGSPKVKNCMFLNNTSVAGGGGIYIWSGSPTVTNCTFSKNDAFGGGGMLNERYSSPTTVTNCIFTDNSASLGGGIYNYIGSATATNCTFTRNTATNSGGGMYNYQSSPRVTNCILWGNAAPTSPEIYGGSPIVAYSDVQGGWGGTGNIDADPCFMDVNNSDLILWNLQLKPGSPCIDAGDNNSVPADMADLDGDGNTVEPTPFEVNGLPRFVDDLCTVDTGNPGTLGPPVVDIGAHEFLPADIDSSGTVNLRDLCIFALHWAETDCGRCGGANLTCDGNVDLNDVRELTDWWLTGTEPEL